MVGDIDFIVSKKEYLKTIKILKNDGYFKNHESDLERTFHWHYASITKKNNIAAVEIHNKILKKNYHRYFDIFEHSDNFYKKNNTHFLSNRNKILNAVLPKLFNDNLYHSKNISLRTVYDIFLFSKSGKLPLLNFKNRFFLKRTLNYLGCIENILNKKIITNIEYKSSRNHYYNSYCKLLNGSKNEILKANIQDYLTLHKNRFGVLTSSFYDKEYRTYALRRMFKLDLYKRIIGIKPNS